MSNTSKMLITLAAAIVFFGIVQAAIDSPSSTTSTASAAKPALAGEDWKIPAGSSSGCDESKIAVDKLRARIEYSEYAHVTGRLINNCDQATGVQVKITVYGKSGDIVKVDDIWPASVKNIPPHSEYPFEWVDRIPEFDRFTVSVIDLKTWN
jgi:maltose-binding protein MalE